MSVTTISSSAMLVDLTIKIWTGYKMDKKVACEVDTINQTQTKAGNYNKKLLAGDNSLQDIQKVVTMVRTYHNSVTIPWSNSGIRLLPTALFLEYKKEIARLEGIYQDIVNQFLPAYAGKIELAKIALGDLFNRDDYPCKDEVKSKFHMSVKYMPIPESGDFRLDIGAQGLTELKRQYEDQYAQNMESAMTDVWDRLHASLEKLSYGLRIKEDGSPGRVFQSVFDSATQLCSVLTSLNIAGDTKLEAMREQLEATLRGVDANDCKQNFKTRVDTRTAIDSILDKF